jgi:hypothetical protein
MKLIVFCFFSVGLVSAVIVVVVIVVVVVMIVMVVIVDGTYTIVWVTISALSAVDLNREVLILSFGFN